MFYPTLTPLIDTVLYFTHSHRKVPKYSLKLHIDSFLLLTTDSRKRDDPTSGGACLARCGRLLVIWRTTRLLLVRATDSSSTAHRLKTLNIST